MALTINGTAEASAAGRLYMARAIVTAPVVFSTAAATGGPLLWNPGATATAPNKTAARLWKVGYAVTTASAAAGALGITGGLQGATAPSSTTAIDTTANLCLGSTNPSQMNVYRIGTVAAAGTFFLPIAQITTAAVTAVGDNMTWIDLDGSITVLPGYFAAVSASATLTSAVMQIAIVWEEINQP